MTTKPQKCHSFTIRKDIRKKEKKFHLSELHFIGKGDLVQDPVLTFFKQLNYIMTLDCGLTVKRK